MRPTLLYDAIGQRYRRRRRPDPRIEDAIFEKLGGARRVLNVGAGAGSYEPRDRFLVAVEPSSVMLRQRSPGAASAVQASATHLPFDDNAFDVSLAILTMHHWPDWRKGLWELLRVSRGNVILLTWDPTAAGFWLVDEYFPEILAVDRHIFPPIEALGRHIGTCSVIPVPIPHDCTDGFLGAYWRRPQLYLNADVRAAISSFAKIPNVRAGLDRLQRDIESGAWQRRHCALLSMDNLDLGYRLVVSGRSAPSGGP